jgi:hypothetical protein
MPYGCRQCYLESRSFCRLSSVFKVLEVTVVHNVLQIKQLLLRTGVPINPKVLGAQTV